MSSATKWAVGGVGQAIRGNAMPSPVQDSTVSGPTNHMSRRQIELDHYWRYYRCSNYEGRKYDWNGKEAVGHLERDVIAHKGHIPPGFYDAGGAMIPLQFRKPSAPYYLAKVVVNRFTSLLFSKKRHPQIESDDPLTEDWLAGFAEETRLWANMIRARTYGGAMGSVGLGFKFVKGKPFVEVHDPRWSKPTFSDRDLLTVKKFEKLYQFTEQVLNKETREWEDAWFWYRRVIDEKRDIVWPKVLVEANETPAWDRERSQTVEHNFGFCPIVWIQNQQVDDDLDGDADCHGIWDLIERIDGLLSQADRGTVANCFGRETPFVTTEGVKTFRDFPDGGRVTVLTHAGNWQCATVRQYGRQPLQRVSFRRGPCGEVITIRATADHRWFLSDETETTSLSVGDRVLSAPHTFSDFDYEIATDEERVWWCRGFMWGDGSTAGRFLDQSRVRLCGYKAQYGARFRESGARVYRPESENFGEDLMVRALWPKKLPSTDTSLNLLRAFVRGYVDADATRGSKGSGRWRCMQATGRASIEFIERSFPAVGLYISHGVDITHEATNYGLRTAQTVRFQVNENSSKHVNSLWRVVDIEADEPEVVWCLEVDDDASFVLPFGFVTRNCDPSIVLSSNADFDAIKKGSGNAMQVEQGGSVQYMEMTGGGIDKAIELAELFEKKALTIARVMLDRNEGGPSRTAEEVEHNYSSMIEQADIYREQYGEKGVKPLLDMVMCAVRKMAEKRVVHEPGKPPRIVRSEVKLPKRKVIHEKTGEALGWVERQLGVGEMVDLNWPQYFTPTGDVVAKAVDAAGKAKDFNLIDQEHATGFVAEYFGVENKAAMLKNIKAQVEAGGLPDAATNVAERTMEQGNPAPSGGW